MQHRGIEWLRLVVLVLCAAVTGCRLEALSGQEAQEALEESAIDSQASALTSASVEISTDFTIGEAAERAAEQVRDFLHAQLPCAEVTLQGNELQVEYGKLPGTCTFRGHRFTGLHTITVDRNDADEVVVEHMWDELSNGKLSVSGGATVTWNLADPSRHVEHELTWTRMADGRTGTGRGDRVQRPLDGGLIEGFSVDGSRSWEGARGRWDLDIDGIEMRWTDPVPQAGAWTLTTPQDKTIMLSFERIDEDTIGVTAEGGHRTIELKVNKLGAVSRR